MVRWIVCVAAVVLMAVMDPAKAADVRAFDRVPFVLHADSPYWVPPAPGMIPKVTSVSARVTLSAAIRRSQAIAISVPPPKADPSRAAKKMIWLRSKPKVRFCRSSRKV